MSDSLEAKIAASLQYRQNIASSSQEEKDVPSKHDGNEAMGPSSHIDEQRLAIMGALTKMQRGHNLLKQAAEKLEIILGDTHGQFPTDLSKHFSQASTYTEESFDTIGRSPSNPQVSATPSCGHVSLPERIDDNGSSGEAAWPSLEIEGDHVEESKVPARIPSESSDATYQRSRSFGRHIQKRLSGGDTNMSTRCLLRRLLKNTLFQSFSVSLIFLTVVLICIDTNARAEGNAANEWVDMALLVCFIAYLFEFLATVFVEGAAVVENHWNYLDAVVITTSLFDYVLSLAGVDGFSILRLLRICRLLRLGRVIRALTILRGVHALKEQYLLMTMMASCVRTVGYAFLLCMFVITVWSIIAVELLNDIVLRLAETTSIWSDCHRCRRSFSSIWDSNITFIQTIVAGDSWGLVAVPVIEDSWWSVFIFLGALSTVIFGVLNMISVVVIDTFAARRAKDLTHVANELEYEEIQERKQLGKIFRKIDGDNSGEISLEELKDGAAKVKEFQQYLRVLDIDDNDLVDLFAMIDLDGSGEVEPDEFIDALYRMKSTESKTAMRFVKHMVSSLFDKTKILDERLDLIQSSVTNKIGDVEKQIIAEFETKPYEQRFEHILEDHADEINNTVKSAIDKAVLVAFESVVASASRKASDAIQGVVLASNSQVAAMNDRLGLGLSCSRQVSSSSSQAIALADRANKQVSVNSCNSVDPLRYARILGKERSPELRGLVHLGESM